MDFIHQVEPYICDNSIKSVNDYLTSGGWLTEFKKTQEFEQSIAEFVNAKYAVAVTSGTVALYLALLAMDIGPGDKVIVPNYTMIATINAVVWAGATPVIADISASNLCMDLDSVKVDKFCKAMIYVSINGRHGDMQKVRDFCREHSLYLLEDAAQSLGARSGDTFLGTFGTVGIYSFTPHKIITTGQGGMVVTDSESIYSKLKKLKDFSRTGAASDWHDGIGYNFKFTDLQAVIGIAQFQDIEFRIAKKKEIFQRYRENLKTLPGIELIETDLNETPPWFVDIIVGNRETRDQLISSLKEKGIGSRPFYPPLNHQTPYQQFKRGEFPVSEGLVYRGLWLPSSVGLQNEQIDIVCDALKTVISE